MREKRYLTILMDTSVLPDTFKRCDLELTTEYIRQWLMIRLSKKDLNFNPRLDFKCDYNGVEIEKIFYGSKNPQEVIVCAKNWNMSYISGIAILLQNLSNFLLHDALFLNDEKKAERVKSFFYLTYNDDVTATTQSVGNALMAFYNKFDSSQCQLNLADDQSKCILSEATLHEIIEFPERFILVTIRYND